MFDIKLSMNYDRNFAIIKIRTLGLIIKFRKSKFGLLESSLKKLAMELSRIRITDSSKLTFFL